MISRYDNIISTACLWKMKYLGVVTALYPFNVIRETSLQSFQYKIFHRFFPCNYTLSIWYKDQHCLCNLCNQTDYLEHYFYFCPNVQHLWHAIQKWWKSILEVTIDLNEIYILFGKPNTNDDGMIDVLNMCILYAKWYIFTCKKDNVQLFLPNYVKLVRDKLSNEKTLCALNNDHTFEEKWSNFYDLL
jgi:hypothetical protein